MAITLKDWLKDQLNGMVSIQNAIIGGDADLTAFAWSGAQLRVHLIGEHVRTRSIRRTLQDATDIGINTLFLIDARIIGEDGKRIAPGDWMTALHELTHQRIYAFRIQNGDVEIVPIHMEEISGSADRKLWYGPKVEFERIRFYRTSVKQPRSLRGNWLIADFGNHAFWRNTDYRRQHAEKAKAYTYRRSTEWRTWSTGNTWQTQDRTNSNTSNTDNRIKSPLKARLDQCYDLLGIKPGSSKDEVKKAFRKRALACHPDTSKMPPEQAETAFRALNDAYDYIKAAHGWN